MLSCAKYALLLSFIVTLANALPCAYVDTLNITNGIVNSDGTITYDNMVFAKDQFEQFDYTLTNDGDTKQEVAAHIRACLDNTNLPCKFIVSINIENGTTNADQSITFDHITFSRNRIATFDYALERNEYGVVVRKSVKPHARGCLDNKLPCNYFESIDISAGTENDDGSIMLEHMQFPPESYSVISYEIKNGNQRQSVPPYRRGCVCNRQACVRLCCGIGKVLVAGQGCVENAAAETRNISMEIRSRTDQLERVKLSDYFGYVSGKACPNYYALSKPFEMNRHGKLQVEDKTYSHLGYCLMLALNESSQETEIRINMCFEDTKLGKYAFLPYGMLLSVPFIVATILVYICIPELRNVHGRCLVCYLTGLAIGYSVLACVQLNGNEPVPDTLCKTAGYVIYFAFSSAFLWLNAISFDLWWTLGGLRGCSQFTENNKFSLYFVYAWGLAFAFTFFAYLLDNHTNIERFTPGIGVNTCFLKHDRLTQTIFFYLPIAILIVINTTLFILTARRIHRVQREVSKIVSRVDSDGKRTRLETHKDNFSLFLRLLIIMGVTWSMEVVSWAISPDSIYFHLTDFINITQGVLIFILFVCKPKIMRLIQKFWRNNFYASKIGSQEETHASTLSSRTSNTRLNQMNHMHMNIHVTSKNV